MLRPIKMLLVMLLIFCGAVQALWVPPDGQIPVSRLVANLEQQLAANPDDPKVLERLGRVHSMAYALGDVEVSVMGKGENPALQLYEHGNDYPAERHSLDSTTISARIGSLLEAIRYYEKAVKVAPDENHIWLGLGYCYDEMSYAAPMLAWPSEVVGAPKQALAALRTAWEDRAVSAYAKAMGEAPEVASSFLTPPVELEAGRYIRLILEPRKKLNREEKKILATVEAMENRGGPRGRMVTPIIFPLDSARPVESLLATDRAVSFDLDGTESGARWPWVHSDTALLVWDAEGSGQVTSGRQLIGSVTWWLFWENGYAVLRALDDDHNAWLEGAELIGLAAWQDANGNARSDDGEVIPLTTLGVRRLAVEHTGVTRGMPMNAQGLEMHDGRVLPTYDWIAAPVE